MVGQPLAFGLQYGAGGGHFLLEGRLGITNLPTGHVARLGDGCFAGLLGGMTTGFGRLEDGGFGFPQSLLVLLGAGLGGSYVGTCL